MARPHPLNDPDFAKLVAQSFANGMSRAEMCDEFSVKDPDTISRWRRDPRVKRYIFKIMEDRVIAITRRIDSKIEAILQHQDLDVRDLLAIRKEFLGGALRAQAEKADEQTIGEAQDWADENPDLLQELLDSMDTVKAKG